MSCSLTPQAVRSTEKNKRDHGHWASTATETTYPQSNNPMHASPCNRRISVPHVPGALPDVTSTLPIYSVPGRQQTGRQQPLSRSNEIAKHIQTYGPAVRAGGLNAPLPQSTWLPEPSLRDCLAPHCKGGALTQAEGSSVSIQRRLQKVEKGHPPSPQVPSQQAAARALGTAAPPAPSKANHKQCTC